MVNHKKKVIISNTMVFYFSCFKKTQYSPTTVNNYMKKLAEYFDTFKVMDNGLMFKPLCNLLHKIKNLLGHLHRSNEYLGGRSLEKGHLSGNHYIISWTHRHHHHQPHGLDSSWTYSLSACLLYTSFFFQKIKIPKNFKNQKQFKFIKMFHLYLEII